jgi:hypothetical protein
MTVARTSAIVYNSEIKGSKENGQDSIILSAFVAIGKPATARMVQRYLKGIEIEYEVNVMSRSTYNLHTDKMKGDQVIRKARLKFVEDKECEVTGRTASYYEPILKLGEQTRLF